MYDYFDNRWQILIGSSAQTFIKVSSNWKTRRDINYNQILFYVLFSKQIGCKANDGSNVASHKGLILNGFSCMIPEMNPASERILELSGCKPNDISKNNQDRIRDFSKVRTTLEVEITCISLEKFIRILWDGCRWYRFSLKRMGG